MASPTRAYRAGESLEDFCRACKTDRMHTVIVVDGDGPPSACRAASVTANTTTAAERGSAWRPAALKGPPAGGPRRRRHQRAARPSGRTEPRPRSTRATPSPSSPTAKGPARRCHSIPTPTLELLLRRVIREETGITPVTPADKWRGGTLVLRPGTAGLQDKSWPIETFFHKVVMLRNRLRTLEQQVNAADLPGRCEGEAAGLYQRLLRHVDQFQRAVRGGRGSVQGRERTSPQDANRT